MPSPYVAENKRSSVGARHASPAFPDESRSSDRCVSLLNRNEHSVGLESGDLNDQRDRRA